MKNYLKLVLFALLAITFVSCQEEDDKDKDPVTNKDYYPLANGTSWEYEVNEVTADGSLSLINYEKYAVDGTESLDGKTVTNVDGYQREKGVETWGDPHENLNGKHYAENNKVYTSVKYIENLLTFEDFNLSFPLNTDLKFVKMIDFAVDSWTVIEMPYTNLPLNYSGQDLKFTGTIKLIAKNLSSENYSNSNLSINESANVVEYSFQLTGDVTMTLSGATLPAGTITVASKRKHWLVNNVGLVKREDSAVSIEATGLLAQFINNIPDIPGNRYEITAYTKATTK